MTMGTVPPLLLEAQNLTRTFHQRGSKEVLTALDGVSVSLAPGESLGLVGESGSGKTTLGRCLVRLMEPTSGRVFFEGRDMTTASGRELRALRRRMQMVFQDSV